MLSGFGRSLKFRCEACIFLLLVLALQALRGLSHQQAHAQTQLENIHNETKGAFNLSV